MQRMGRDRKKQNSIDESTDTYDTIEWLLENVPNNNGRVGTYGVSYDGWTTVMSTIDPHPALRAASEQATPADMWMGDDFHHNGAFRLSYGFEYAFSEEASNVDTLFPFGVYDTYDWYLKLGPLSNVNDKYFYGKIPTWNNYVQHPNYDEFWQRQALAYRLTVPTVPTLHVAGWWDQEDFYGPLKTYELLEKKDTKNMNFIVIGPWNHGGWAGAPGNRLGNITFDTATGRTFREAIQPKWFAYYLKDKGDHDFPEAMTFQTGSNQWKTYSAWPPGQGVTMKKIFLHPNGKLSFNEPSSGDDGDADSFLSDPSRPVPYRTRPVEQTYGPGSRWFTWLVEDQRFVHNRPDVLSWETDELLEDVVVTGQVSARLFASTTGSDADWIVKLIDVYPSQYPKEYKMGGYQLMVANDVFRGRYRNSFEKPQPITPHEILDYTVDLHHINHAFQKGHKIMVQVQSTWFPIIDRNPQKYVDNIFLAKDSDFHAATHRIHRSKKHPTHLLLPVVDSK
ncbi:MAG TPA: CocE/NonD family hydrolase [Bacteroidota bacterium]|nr:CocE/NonD family hydrolase [Bacteroidota bacterium]